MKTLKPELAKQAEYERSWASFCRLASFEVKRLLADRVVKGGDLSSTFIARQSFPNGVMSNAAGKAKVLVPGAGGKSVCRQNDIG